MLKSEINPSVVTRADFEGFAVSILTLRGFNLKVNPVTAAGIRALKSDFSGSNKCQLKISDPRTLNFDEEVPGASPGSAGVNAVMEVRARSNSTC
jgi:hypothetical protein